MRLAELSHETGVASATLKYYLREGLLHAGEIESRTQASYDGTHVARVRLVRALVESGGLSLARAKAVIVALDDPPENRHDLLGVAQRALIEPDAADAGPDWTAFATAAVRGWGWDIEEGDPLLPLLGAQLRAVVDAGVELGDGTVLDQFAEAADRIAAADMSTLPEAPAAAIRQAIVGTVLTDPIVLTLRRLAQQHQSAIRFKQ